MAQFFILREDVFDVMFFPRTQISTDLFLKVGAPSKQGLNSNQKKGHERVPGV